jgi:hypothetical protein
MSVISETCTGTGHVVRRYCACTCADSSQVMAESCACTMQAPDKSWLRAAHVLCRLRIRHGLQLSVPHSGSVHVHTQTLYMYVRNHYADTYTVVRKNRPQIDVSVTRFFCMRSISSGFYKTVHTLSLTESEKDI